MQWIPFETDDTLEDTDDRNDRSINFLKNNLKMNAAFFLVYLRQYTVYSGYYLGIAQKWSSTKSNGSNLGIAQEWSSTKSNEYTLIGLYHSGHGDWAKTAYFPRRAHQPGIHDKPMSYQYLRKLDWNLYYIKLIPLLDYSK